MSIDSLEIQAKQLLPPKTIDYSLRSQASSSYVVRSNLVDVRIIKPDVHLNDDLLSLSASKNNGDRMISIKSSTRLRLSPYKPHKITIDSKKLFNFGDMTSLCRPERDLSLKVPLITASKSLRTYKLGTSPEAKVSLLKSKLINKMDELRRSSKSYDNHMYNPHVINNLLSKSRVYQSSVINHMIQNRIQQTNKDNAAVNNNTNHIIDDETESTKSDTSISKSNNIHIHSLNKKIKKSIIINPSLSSVNIHLYKKVSVDLSDCSSSTPTIDPDNNNNPSSPQPAPSTPLYTPATFRLPVEETVPGFGNIPPHIEQRLTAYRSHDNIALQNVAALMDTIQREASILSLENDGTVAGDTYKDSRKEVFLLENSRDDDGALHNHNDSQLLSDASFNAAEAENNAIDSSHRGEMHNADKIVAGTRERRNNEHLALSTASKGRLHCMKCYRNATLWCVTCSKAYCGLCWGKIIHHDLNKMMYFMETTKEIERLKESNKLKLSRGNSYSRSILFQANPFGTCDTKDRIKPSTAVGNQAHAMIPLPSKIVTHYTDYAQPPVVLTGTGAIDLHEIHTRPYTAPITTPSDMQKVHNDNYDLRRNDSDKQRELISVDYNEAKQSTMRMRNSLESNGGDAKKKLLSLQSHFPHTNKGDVVVRSPLKLHPLITTTTSAYAVGSAPGSLDFAYSSKPSTGSRPLSGIAHDMKPPEEWDFARSKELPERELSYVRDKVIITKKSR